MQSAINYNEAIWQANQFLHSGDEKKALEAFKTSISGENLKTGDLEKAAGQEILAEFGSTLAIIIILNTKVLT
ncbi:MAG: hypothetical protein ACOYXT_10015 [Bacteroidota bacterium]